MDIKKCIKFLHLARALEKPEVFATLRFIKENPGCQLNEISNALKLEQSVMSRHTILLEEIGLIVKNVVDRHTEHNVDRVNFKRIMDCIDYWDDQISFEKKTVYNKNIWEKYHAIEGRLEKVGADA